jgi:2-polyprenyl-6-methoxyphenol hydroxylase-like FAD-dependent oxidoreductase
MSLYSGMGQHLKTLSFFPPDAAERNVRARQPDVDFFHCFFFFFQLANFKKEWYLIHRAQLHSAIKSLAISEEGEGPAAQLFLHCNVIKLNKSNPSITLSGGETYTGDFIIGADGVHVSL